MAGKANEVKSNVKYAWDNPDVVANEIKAKVTKSVLTNLLKDSETKANESYVNSAIKQLDRQGFDSSSPDYTNMLINQAEMNKDMNEMAMDMFGFAMGGLKVIGEMPRGYKFTGARTGVLSNSTIESIVKKEVGSGYKGMNKITYNGIEASTLKEVAIAPGKGGVSPAGRAFQKHAGDASRAGTFTGEITGNAAKNTNQGAAYLDDILNNPNTTYTVKNTKAYGEVLEVRMPDGTGALWSTDGTKFIGFREKFTSIK